MTAGKTHADAVVFYLLQILLDLQLLERLEEHLLPFLADTDARVEDFDLENEVLGEIVILLLLDVLVQSHGKAVQSDQNAPLE